MVADGTHVDPGFRSSGSPVAIEYFAPYAFSQEPYEPSMNGDVGSAPLSFLVTNMIFDILSDSSAFTGEVISWARRTRGPDPVSRREEFQRWWAENKIHFEQEDYKAVMPGHPIPNVLEAMDGKRHKEGPPPLEETHPKQPAPVSQPTIAKPAAATVVQTPTPSVESQAPVWPWAVGVAALIAASVGVLKRRSRPTCR